MEQGHARRRSFASESVSVHSIPVMPTEDETASHSFHFQHRDSNRNLWSSIHHQFTVERSLHTSGYGFSNRRIRLALTSLSLVVFAAWIVNEWPSHTHIPSASKLSVHEKTAHVFGYTTCPDPADPIVPPDRPIHPYYQSCSTLDASFQPAGSKFTIQLCQTKATCNSFSVRVVRNDQEECRRMEETLSPQVEEAERAEWMRVGKGPDSFLLRTSGSQRWVSEMSVYEGNCTYRFDVTLSNGGLVWLELWWLYTEYAYFDEIHPGWPTNHNLPLFNRPLRLSLCAERCPMQFAPRLHDVETTQFTPYPAAISQNTDPCELDYFGMPSIEGIYLPRHPLDVIQPPVPVIPPRLGDKPLMGVYEYYNPFCKYSHAGAQFANNRSACVDVSKKVLFAGDSHTRYAAFGFKYRLDGHQDHMAESPKGAEPYHFKYGNLDINFLWNTFDEFRKWDWEFVGTFDSVALSFGAWGLMRGDPSSWFREHIESICSAIDAAQRSNDPQGLRTRHNVFIFWAPIPPRLDDAAKRNGDQRTNHAFAVWREIAMEILEKYGWRIVDQYTRGMPVVLEILNADLGHLSPGSAFEGILDEVLAKMEVC